MVPQELSQSGHATYSEGTNKAVRRGWNPTPDLAATSRMGDALASIQATAPDPTSVYRYYDSIGVLIYVGITRQGMGRNVQHNGKAEWWPFVARQEVDHHPTRDATLLCEKKLIQKHRPPFNKQHNPSYALMREAYLAYATTFSVGMSSPQDLYQAVGKKMPLEIISYEPRRLILRSKMEHGPLACMLEIEGQPAVWGRRRRYGSVERLEQFGPVIFLHCTLRSSKKVRPPEGGIGAAEILMGWNSKTKCPTLRQVAVTEGDLCSIERVA